MAHRGLILIGKHFLINIFMLPGPLNKGWAAFLYEGFARRLILGRKRGDSTDAMRPAVQSLLLSFEELLLEDSLIISVQLNWRQNF